MTWDEDYTAAGQGPPALRIGSTSTQLKAERRHMPMQGDSVNRDEIEDGSRGDVILSSNCLRSTRDDDGRNLKFAVEKYDGDDWSGYRLRDVETQELVTVDGDWVRLHPEGDKPEEDTIMMFKEFEEDSGRTAWLMWFKSRGSVVHLNDTGYLNLKDSGRHALFNFYDGNESTSSSIKADVDAGDFSRFEIRS
ncbi:hypothetical protein P153DRAFT_355800 [Dothidotthia symphoricarpi CBS 119687]|uniref:Uncharacterized protein n=1 Tax=Dothidotthia symphoricarpi CBS 119687 TaxID=1392245 RepID=A0A6A6AGT2_9PLEO|nr:uncharacterized protein P153DRAFT_355800 [Dothidotthia symphoricarpi CBS 119687]KAF2131010.1 hypothetical protein P153DRAFT_355800 [Dothidotthia symphoricarpi CBS 119687]